MEKLEIRNILFRLSRVGSFILGVFNPGPFVLPKHVVHENPDELGYWTGPPTEELDMGSVWLAEREELYEDTRLA